MSTWLAETIDHGGVGRTAALAHGLEAVSAAGRLELVEEGGGHAHARRAERMADGDSAAAGVELGGVGNELARPHERDGGERLVALDGVEVLDAEPGPSKELARDGVGRAQDQDRVLGAHRERLEAGAWCELQLV